MDDKQFDEEIKKLAAKITTLAPADQEHLKKQMRETVERHKQLKDKIGAVGEVVDNLRIGIKYLVFDLEATKRENQRLKDELHKYGH